MCYDDVRDTLDRLAAAGYDFAMASNFDGRLHPVCDGLPDVHPIQHRIVSASVQFRKPAPEFYRSVVSAFGCEPHQILMIGDDHEHDFLAPQAAGFRALHLDRKPTERSSALQSLTELADLLTNSQRT
jgi:putative hydrolase of the HAD superfamily